MPDENNPYGLGRKEQEEEGSTRPLVIDVREDTTVADFIHTETNLETIGYFKAGYKRDYGQAGEAREVIVANDRVFRFVPSVTFGYPNTEDQDYQRGLLKLCEEAADCTRRFDERGKPRFVCRLPQPLGFGSRRLIRAAGKTESPRERRAMRDFLRRNKTTSIFGKMRVRRQDGKVVQVEVGDEPWFRKVVLVGDATEDGGKASQNLVWFAEWFLVNYQTRYLKISDNALYQRLKTPIARTIAPILSNGWFATRGSPWRKRYDELANQLGVLHQKYLSDIKHQLEPSHRELQREGYLVSWTYEKSDGGGHIITWTPGQQWFAEQDEYRKRQQTLTAAYHNQLIKPTSPDAQQVRSGAEGSPALAERRLDRNSRLAHISQPIADRLAEIHRALADSTQTSTSLPSQSSDPAMRQNVATEGLESGKNLAANAATNPPNNPPNVATDSATTEPENAANPNAETPAA